MGFVGGPRVLSKVPHWWENKFLFLWTEPPPIDWRLRYPHSSYDRSEREANRHTLNRHFKRLKQLWKLLLVKQRAPQIVWEKLVALIPDNNIYLAVSCAPEAEPTFVLFCLILNILNLVFINSMHVLYYYYILLYMQISLVLFCFQFILIIY